MNTRKIIRIDEELCDGCGQCIPGCAEGALEIIEGKARLVRDMYCDGLGACLGHCPTGALTVIEREAEAFDEQAAMARMHELENQTIPATARADEIPTVCGCPGEAVPASSPEFAPKTTSDSTPETPPLACGCPGTAAATFDAPRPAQATAPHKDKSPSGLTHWPVQIRLAPPHAPFLKNRDLVIAADCAAVALPDFHRDFVTGNAILMGCPKFDTEADYTSRLADIFTQAKPRSITVLRMEVPCCSGLPHMAKTALNQSGQNIPYREITVARQGAILED